MFFISPHMIRKKSQKKKGPGNVLVLAAIGDYHYRSVLRPYVDRYSLELLIPQTLLPVLRWAALSLQRNTEDKFCKFNIFNATWAGFLSNGTPERTKSTTLIFQNFNFLAQISLKHGQYFTPKRRNCQARRMPLKVLLPSFLRLHCVQNRLSFRLVSRPKSFDFFFHFHIQCLHSVLQFFAR